MTGMTRTGGSAAVMLFTRDLRLHDNPAFAAACESDLVVPLFVLDDRILGSARRSPNRIAFLSESLADLGSSLHQRGSSLVFRRGDVARETAEIARRTGATVVHIAGDATRYSETRTTRLAAALAELGIELRLHRTGTFVVEPGRLHTEKADHFEALGPYTRRWLAAPLRPIVEPPAHLHPLGSVEVLSTWISEFGVEDSGTSPGRQPGGETAGRALLQRWLDREEPTAEKYNDFALDGTSRLSPYLHFGCLSPLEVRMRSAGHHDRLVHQLALRDYSAQLLAAHPDAGRRPLRDRGDDWPFDRSAVEAWKTGTTGFPLIDASMRQLRQEGWMHPQARWVAGHFLTKTLYQDWRIGADHFAEWLTDGDVASNTINWQIVAGLGPDYRFNLIYDPSRQALLHYPSGSFVRRYVLELRALAGAGVHSPWTLPADRRRSLDYPDRIVDAREGNSRFRALRQSKRPAAHR